MRFSFDVNMISIKEEDDSVKWISEIPWIDKLYKMEDRILDLRLEIVRTIKHPTVLQFMIPHLIDQSSGKEIKRLYSIATERANHRMLDLIIRSNQSGKWTTFQDALKHSNYPYLATLLSSDGTCYSHQRRILELFAPFLEQVLDPQEVVDKLYQLDIIDVGDVEEILIDRRNNGSIRATMVLLERIQTHLAPDKWYSGFLQALYESSYQDLVRDIVPDFYEKKQLSKEYKDMTITGEACKITGSVTTDNITILENINRFWAVIVEMLDLRCTIDRLVPAVISSEKRNELLQDVDHTNATRELLDHVVKTENGVAFVQCLEMADYPYLACLLKRTSLTQHNTYCEKVIQIFSPGIQYQINIPDIVSHLVEQGVVNRDDIELIQTVYQRKGNTAAAVVLLDRMQTRLSPQEWYCKFLKVLMMTSHEHVVEIVEPDSIKDPDRFAIKMSEMGQHSVENGFTSHGGGIIDEEIKMVCEKKEVYMKSILRAYDRIQEEEDYMIGFVREKCDKLRKDVDERAQKIEPELDGYKMALLRVQERDQSSAQCGTTTEDIMVLRQQYKQYSKVPDIEVKFERKLNLHFLLSVGYVTEAGNIYRGQEGIDRHRQEDAPVDHQMLIVDTDVSKTKSDTDHGSSHLEVIGLPLLTDDENESVICNNEPEEVVGVEAITDACEFELVVSRQIPALHKLKMRDIAVLTGPKLVGICERTKSLIILDTETFTVVLNIPLMNENVNKIAVLDATEVAVISPDLKPIIIISLNETETIQYEWECEFEKCTIVSHKGVLYVLCTGAHLHVYRLSDGQQDIYNLSVDQTWRPKSAVLGDDGTELFISDIDSVYCFKYFHDNNREQRFQWKYFDEDEESYIDRRLFVGLSVFDGHVIFLDKNNNALLKVSSHGGLYRGSIRSSSFSDCDLVAFDRQGNLVHLISYRYNEYKIVKLVPNPSVANVETFDPYVTTN